MPFLAELSMEFCDVETRGVSRDEVVRAVRQAPRDPHVWFLTLRRGDGDAEEYMDATMDDEATFSLRVEEEGVKWRTTARVGEELLEALFLSFYEHDRAWKTLCAWEEVPPKGRFGLKDLFKR